ncbi:MAG: vWA domain-containing protein [Gammaproteobacteria bacterium]
MRQRIVAILAAGVVLVFGAPAHAESNLLFIFDASGSMKEKIASGETRLAVAKRAMQEALGQMPADMRLGLLLYGHRRSKDCTDVELVAPIGSEPAGTLAGRIAALDGKGETPIAESLRQAVRSFAALKGQSNRVVLVTDGIEECGGDPCAAAQEVNAAGLNLKVDIIGFTLNKQERQTVKCVTERTGGKFYEAENLPTLAAALTKAVAETAPPVEPPPVAEGKAELLGWHNPHPAGYNGSFHHATLVDPHEVTTDRIAPQGDRDYYALHTGAARGKLQVRFEQTGPTAINPHLQLLYGGGVRDVGQPQPGTDLTVDIDLDGESGVAYVGVWDEGDDAFSDTPYRLVIAYEGAGKLPDPQAVATPIRFDMSRVSRVEAEPNDDHFKATDVVPGEYAAGRIGTKGDVDFFKIKLEAQATGTLVAILQQLDASPVKPKLVFYDRDRAESRSYWHELPGMDLSGQQTIKKRYPFYYIAVSDPAADAETGVPYVLHIELVK